MLVVFRIKNKDLHRGRFGHASWLLRLGDQNLHGDSVQFPAKGPPNASIVIIKQESGL